MVLYFSGTGNSRFIAKTIRKVLSDDIVCLNDVIKRHESKEFTSKAPYVFVLPTYAWRIPRLISDFIKSAIFNGCKDCYFVMTCGSSMGKSEHYIKKLMTKKEMNVLGVAEIKMPENYIARYKAPSKEKQKILIEEGEKKAFDIAKMIAQQEKLPSKRLEVVDHLLSGIVNPVFYKFCVKSDDFYVKSSCIGCHRCQNACPTNNIFMQDNKPKWKHKCVHCMACISICPVKAIEYEGRTETKERYYLE